VKTGLHALGLLMSLMLCGALAGCFHPTIEDGGFACDPTQVPSCPEGLFCVDGRCHVSPTISGNGGGGGGGGGGGSTGGSGDMSSGGASDLGQHPPADLASSSGSCAHDICTTGAKLTSGCDPCVTTICAQDSYCCTTKWSSQCVQEVASICNRTCP
jgi:hypothetical protein